MKQNWFFIVFLIGALVGALLVVMQNGICADEHRNEAVQRSACGHFCGTATVRDALCVCNNGRWKALP